MRDFIAGVTLLACLFVFSVSFIALFKSLPKLKLPTRKSALKGFGVGFALFILSGIIIPKPDGPEQSSSGDKKVAGAKKGTSDPLPTVKASNSKIAEVDAYKETKHAQIKVDLGDMWSSDDLPDHVGMITSDIGKAVKAGVSDIPAEIETITIWFTSIFVDPYGNEERSKAMQFTIKTEDLRKINYDNVTSLGVLNFAYDIDARYAVRPVLAKYCSENGEDSRMFCMELVK